MNLTITVNDVVMTVEGEAFELAHFARSVGKATTAAATPADTAPRESGLSTKEQIARAIGPKSKPPRAKSTPTCKTCGGRGHRSNHCPSKAAG